jgi:poly(hydroxyalkanoate) depolymerase family esterase
MPSFDAQAINDTIRQALSAAGITSAKGAWGAGDDVVDIEARVVDDRPEPAVAPGHRPPVDEGTTPGGSFRDVEFRHRASVRSYKLFVPARLAAAPPLIVMLHGCTQSADDFAAGTRMNRLAAEQGFLVVYPEQTTTANPSKCWNWFKAHDQVRDGGEPALIAGIVRDVATRHDVDTRRIFVAGLSAGAAMAVILGQTYPELFAGVGAHSGLPYRSAHDIPSALAAMKGGRSGVHSLKAAASPVAAARKALAQAVPTIVFHGDRDHTVQLSNGVDIAQQAGSAYAAAGAGAALRATTQRVAPAGGRSYSRTVHADAAGQTRVETWTVHGAGHAWAGGSHSGSYTDAKGPDASAEMLRFFLSLPRAGAA